MNSNNRPLRRPLAAMIYWVILVASFVATNRAVADSAKSQQQVSSVCQFILEPPDSPAHLAVIKRVTETIKHLQFRYIDGREGFTLTHPTSDSQNDARPMRTVQVRSMPNDFGTAVQKEIWKSHGRRFELLNVGLKNLEPYSIRVNRYVLGHLIAHPDDNLTVLFDSKRMRLADYILSYRWPTHEAVMRSYHEAKPYLNENDFRILKDLNEASTNNDVITLLDHDPTTENSSISNRVLLTIQISYFGTRSFFRPSVDDLLKNEIPNSHENDLLPFEYRIPVELRAKFREAFYSKFPARHTCEMLRYASFDSTLPQDVRDRFLLYAFQKVVDRKVKYIVAGADPATARLYRRYGFQIFSKLPTSQNKEPEYIIYLSVNSPQFLKMMNRLRQNAQHVDATTKGIDRGMRDI